MEQTRFSPCLHVPLHTHETSWEVDVGADFAVDFDQALHDNLGNFIVCLELENNTIRIDAHSVGYIRKWRLFEQNISSVFAQFSTVFHFVYLPRRTSNGYAKRWPKAMIHAICVDRLMDEGRTRHPICPTSMLLERSNVSNVSLDHEPIFSAATI